MISDRSTVQDTLSQPFHDPKLRISHYSSADFVSALSDFSQKEPTLSVIANVTFNNLSCRLFRPI